ncbi:MAG: YraN family protein [Elusimicrobia bacterium]|nr:YraN family protein [Elusimicrobiota bacterium]
MRIDVGALAEGRAAAFLESLGLTVLHRRFRCRAGELDLVARDGETIVFVEVKARGGDAFGSPEEAVDGPKRRRLARAAAVYLAQRGLAEAPARFDVVAVTPEGIRHLPDAFRADRP